LLNTKEKNRTMSLEIGCGIEILLNFLDCGKAYMIKILNPSNSKGLESWTTTVNAKGIISKAGRYGGTFAHYDIAFEFASWISAESE